MGSSPTLGVRRGSNGGGGVISRYHRDRAEEEAAIRAQERECGYHLPDPVQEAGRRDYEFEVALARTPYRPVSEELAGLRAEELEAERELEEWIYEQEEW